MCECNTAVPAVYMSQEKLTRLRLDGNEFSEEAGGGSGEFENART